MWVGLGGGHGRCYSDFSLRSTWLLGLHQGLRWSGNVGCGGDIQDPPPINPQRVSSDDY